MNPTDFLLELYYNLADYIQTPQIQKIILAAKLVSFGICLVLLFSIIILLSRSKATWWIAERIDSFKKVKLPQQIERHWQKIKNRLEKNDEANLKLAVIEADNLLDDILKRMGLEGKDMGERLEKISKEQLKSLDEIWEAHRLRNLIVHESGIHIGKDEAEKSIGAYENALKELEVL